eukprot:gene15937-17538_t
MSFAIRHLVTGKCIRPEVADPPENTAIALDPDCSPNTCKFWFVPQALYTIRHFTGTCWNYIEADNLIKLADSYICDRFFYQNSKNLRHYRTGKCVIAVNNQLTLTSDCSNPATIYYLDNQNLIHSTISKCAHPIGGGYAPTAGKAMGLFGCPDLDRIRTYFFDDRDILDVSIISEGCDKYPAGSDCAALPKGHITVNGYQHSRNTKGINIVLFDYHSAIFEHRSTYNVYRYSSARDGLTTLLNNPPSGKILFMSVKDSVTINTNLASALQKHGVSVTFATSPIPKSRCSMASVSYTGQNRKSWEKSESHENCSEQVSTIKTKIYIFRDFKGINDCSEEMGSRTAKLPNSRFSAPSIWDNYHPPSQARLYKVAPGWCAANGAPLSHHLQIDLGTKKFITGIATQGHGKGGWHFISKYDIHYSLDGITWKNYIDDSGTKKTFIGVERTILGETKVNWFSRILARFIRIIPIERDAAYSYTHCLRMELFGCSPKGPIFHDNSNPSNQNKSILDTTSEEISFFAIAPLSKKVEIDISKAATNTTLAQNIDQFQICSVNETSTINNGTIINEISKIEKIINNDARKISTSAKIQYNLKDVDYYNLDIAIKNTVIDAKESQPWTTYTYETDEETLVYSYPLQFKRNQQDRSLLNYIITDTAKDPYQDGDVLSLNISISHQYPLSFSNAYDLQLFIYYDTKFLILDSFKTIHKNDAKDGQTIDPSQNETKPGLIKFKTDILWLLTNHFIQLNFKFSFPKEVFKGTNCSGGFIIDFAYKTNLEKFHGISNTTKLNKLVPYKCKVSQTRSSTSTAGKMTVPGFSILYDDVKDDIYVCRKRTKYSERNKRSCYLQKNNDLSWYSIPYIASVIGIDTNKQVLFGLDAKGNGYVQLDNHLHTFWHVEDSVWTSIQDQPHIRKSKTSSSVTSLPAIVDQQWVFPSTANQKIAATSKGIMRKFSGEWKMIMSL